MKTRAELKKYFQPMATPTAGQFADLIGTMLCADDGLEKTESTALSITAGISASHSGAKKEAIRFYEQGASKDNPSWVLSVGATGQSPTQHLGISDGAGNTRLTIDHDSGHVTVEKALQVKGGLSVTGAGLTVGKQGETQSLTVYGDIHAKGGLTVGADGAARSLTVYGDINAEQAVNAKGGLSVTGAGLTVGKQDETQSLTVYGDINAKQMVNAEGGLVVGQENSAQSMNVWGRVHANGGIAVGDSYGTGVTRSGVRCDPYRQAGVLLPPMISPNVDFRTGVSIHAWIYPYTVETVYIVACGATSSTEHAIALHTSVDGRFAATVYHASASPKQVCSAASIVRARTWTHIAVTVSGDGVATLYRNGVALSGAELSSSSDSNIGTPSNVTRTYNYIGIAPWSDTSAFVGVIAEVSIWKGAHAPNPDYFVHPSALGLVGYWRLNDGSGTIAKCAGGILGDATLMPGAHFTKGSALMWYIGGKVNIAEASIAQEPEIDQGNGVYYFKDSFNIVHLGGARASNSTPLQGVIWTLPVGYRPTRVLSFSAPVKSTTGGWDTGVLKIATDGKITMLTGNPLEVSFDGISFRAAD